MATIVHCLYCFEALSASLELRKPQSLSQIESFWTANTSWDFQEESHSSDEQHQALSGLQSTHKTEQKSVREGQVHIPSPHRSNHSFSASETPGRTASLDNASGSSSSFPSTASATSSSRSIPSPSPKASSGLLSASASRTKVAIHPSVTSAQQHPMFVTWNTVTISGHRRLRGCIGTFEPLELEHGLRTYALTAAFEDTRFSQIQARELPNLECNVTLLTNFEPIPSPMSWEIGKHGLRINFIHHSQRYSATYLPDVALEQGWTKLETLVSLMHKAGWRGRDEDWEKVTDLKVVRYQGHKVSAKYADWLAFHDWIESQ